MASLRLRPVVATGLLLLILAFLLTEGFADATLRDVARGYSSFVTIFMGIFIEALPFLLLGTLASGLVEAFISRESLARWVPRNRLGSALAGSLMGLVFPVCECGVVPLTRRLFRKGLPLPVGIAFLLAAPVVNPVVIASTYAAFGWGPLLLGRIGLTLLIALAVGLIFGLAKPARLLRPSPEAEGPVEGDPALAATSLSARLTRALTVAADEFFEMGRYLVLGSLLAAGMQTVVPQSTLLDIGGGALSSVVAMLVLAFVLSVCSTVDAFLALAFLNSFTAGSILSFLVFGPMVDIKSVLMFYSVFRRRVVVYLVLLPLMMTLFIGVYLNLNVGW